MTSSAVHSRQMDDDPQHLLAEAVKAKEKADDDERKAIIAALEQAKGNVLRAAELLGITGTRADGTPTATTLHKKIARFGLRDLARDLRRKLDGWDRGHPPETEYDPAALARAWSDSGRSLPATAVAIGLRATQRNVVRDLLHRYGIPDPPTPRSPRPPRRKGPK